MHFSFMCTTWRIHVWWVHVHGGTWSLVTNSCAHTPWRIHEWLLLRIHAWLLHLCNVTHLCTAHSCMRRDTFMHGLFVCATWLIEVCDMNCMLECPYIVRSLFVAEACMKNTHIMNINEWSQSCSVNDWEYICDNVINTHFIQMNVTHINNRLQWCGIGERDETHCDPNS